MPKARKDQIDYKATPYYHCISRCVRRAFLCGTDKVTGKNYDHRKQWIVDRMKLLTEVFPMQICAYAVMSNHYHIILHVDADQVKTWSEEEVLRRWRKLFVDPKNPDPVKYRQYKDRVYDLKKIRKRLTEIGWFMRCMNENIARESNREDHCKGRFWEGRFKSQALLDEGALLTCMTYVDLNPIRAGMCDKPEESDFTSIQERIQQYWSKSQQKPKKVTHYQEKQAHPLGKGLAKFARNQTNDETVLPINRKEYFELLDWTGRILKQNKKGKIPDKLKPILQRLDLNETEWIDSLKNFRQRFFHAIGHMQKLSSYARRRKTHWVKGIGSAKRMYR